MNESDVLGPILQDKLKALPQQQLTTILTCNICEGVLRFAHTIVDCGHTFCQVCIFGYIRGFKGRNPAVKCPECHSPVDNNYKKSIIKDVFKQNIVNIMWPELGDQDELIVARVQELFPDYSIRFILDEFKSYNEVNKSARGQQSEIINAKLPQKVKQKLGMNFDFFCEQILSEDSFKRMQTTMQNMKLEAKIVEIKPKCHRDYTFIGISNQMKALNLTIPKIKRFLEKKAIERITETDQVPSEWRTVDDQLEIRIYLQVDGKDIEETDDLEEVLSSHKSMPIFYSLTK